MFGFDTFSFFFALAKAPKPWNEDPLIPWDEALLDSGSIGSKPRRDSGVDIYDDLSLGIIPKHEILYDFGPIGMGRPLPAPRLEMAAPQPRRAPSLPSFIEDDSSSATTTTSSSYSSSAAEVVAPPDWSDASVWQQHLEVLKQQEEHDAREEGRPERRLNHQTGEFLNEPVKQKAWKRSPNQYVAAQQYWAQYLNALEWAPEPSLGAEGSTQFGQNLRPDATEFVPSWVV